MIRAVLVMQLWKANGLPVECAVKRTIRTGTSTNVELTLNNFTEHEYGRCLAILNERRNGMKVFCIGFGKTGTTSLGVAMRRLGYRHCGFRAELLEGYAAGEMEYLVNVIKKFDSFDDFPWPLCYRWIAEQFPESKFILTLRESPETWYRSLVRHAERGVGTKRNRLLAYGRKDPRGEVDYHLELYRQQMEEVEEFFGKQSERLLPVCWERGDGWPELCRFLNAEIPNEAFPHVNRHEADYKVGMVRMMSPIVRAIRNHRKRR